MKTDTKSHNTRLDLSVKELLIPNWAQVGLDLTIAFLLLAFLSIRSLWTYFNSGVLDANKSDVSDIINQKAQGIHNFLDTISKGRFLQIVFWLFVGCVVYMIIWFIRSLFTNIRNDIVADEYVHPGGYNRSTYWQSVIARKVFFFSIIVVLIGYVTTALKVAILLSQVAYNDINNFSPSHSLPQIFGSILLTAVMLQVFIVLVRIARRSWQFIYSDL